MKIVQKYCKKKCVNDENMLGWIFVNSDKFGIARGKKTKVDTWKSFYVVES